MGTDEVCFITDDLLQTMVGHHMNLSEVRALSLQPSVTRAGRIRLLEGFEGLSGLQELDVSGNWISVIENLSCLTHLRILNLADNNIRWAEGQLAGPESIPVQIYS